MDSNVPAKPVEESEGKIHLLYPPRHGETGTALSELYYFNRLYWSKIFKQAGWRIKSLTPIDFAIPGMSYSGT